MLILPRNTRSVEYCINTLKVFTWLRILTAVAVDIHSRAWIPASIQKALRPSPGLLICTTHTYTYISLYCHTSRSKSRHTTCSIFNVKLKCPSAVSRMTRDVYLTDLLLTHCTIAVGTLPTCVQRFWSPSPTLSWSWWTGLPPCQSVHVRGTGVCLRRSHMLEQAAGQSQERQSFPSKLSNVIIRHSSFPHTSTLSVFKVSYKNALLLLHWVSKTSHHSQGSWNNESADRRFSVPAIIVRGNRRPDMEALALVYRGLVKLHWSGVRTCWAIERWPLLPGRTVDVRGALSG